MLLEDRDPGSPASSPGSPHSWEAPCSAPPATPLHGPTGRAAGRPTKVPAPHPRKGCPAGSAHTQDGKPSGPENSHVCSHSPQTSRAKKGEACPAVSGPSLRMEPHCPLGPLPLQAVLSDRSLRGHVLGRRPALRASAQSATGCLLKNENRF